MEKTQNQKMQRLMTLNGYWATRSVMQLRYLEELQNCGAWTDAELTTQAIDRLYSLWQERDGLGKEDVLAWERTYLEPVRKTAKALRVDCVGHAHIDMNWQWSYDETVMATLETFRTMLHLMEEFPDIVFLQSQASVYRIVERHASWMLPQIRAAIRRGQWEPAAVTWVEPDKNMPCDESMARHLLYTRQYLKKLLGLEDADFLLDFEPDTFGHTAQVPMVLAAGGVRYYYHCRGESKENLYRWEAPSGARLTVMLDLTWYNAPIEWNTFLYLPSFCSRYGIDRMCHVFGVGDHGGGITRRDITRIHDMAQWPCMPDIGFGRLRDFFAYLEDKPLPLLRGERNFVFDGCYTTQSRIKRGNRMAERTLYASETMNALAALHGACPYEPERFADAWEKVLFNHFHDILPGSGVTATREYAMAGYQEALACAGVQLTQAMRGLSDRIDTSALLQAQPIPADSLAEGGGGGFGVAWGRFSESAGVTGGECRLYHVFNPTQSPWDGLVELTVWDWAFAPGRAAVSDERGINLPRMVVDETPQSYWAHQYFRVLVKCSVPAFGYRTLLLKEDDAPVPLPTLPEAGWPRVDAERPLILENDKIRVALEPHTLRVWELCDAVTGESYLAPGQTGGFDLVEEDDVRGMTAWRIGRHITRHDAITAPRLTEFAPHPLRSSLCFTGRVRSSEIQVRMYLDQGSRMLHIQAHCRWKEFGAPGQPIPQLSFSLPLKRPCETFACDTPFLHTRRAPGERDVPAQSYAYASGVMLTTDCKYGFRCTGQRLSVTLLRTAYDPDDMPEIGNHEFAIGFGLPEGETPEALRRESMRFVWQPMAVATMPHKGTLPPAGTWMAVDGLVQISGIKLAEDRSGDLIIRLFCLEGRAGQVRLTPPKPVEGAWLADIHEHIVQSAQLAPDGAVVAEIGPYGVASVRLHFRKSM